MEISARILLDSLSPSRDRLTTMELVYPRFIHAELMTHRSFSRNSASSRAIPISKMIEQVDETPAFPIFWGSNQKGMQAGDELSTTDVERCKYVWTQLLNDTLIAAEELVQLKLHKQLVNRLLEPFSWITVIVTATDWVNFFTQRCHPDAQPEIRALAMKMLEAYKHSTTKQILSAHDYHLPLIQPDERNEPLEVLKRISVARCARVSYLTHEGIRDFSKDIDLYEKLVSGGANGHRSPFEHVATPVPGRHANFLGWMQYRSEVFPNEPTELPELE